MALDPTSRLIKSLDAVSQFVNVTFLPNHTETTANESLSGRAYRCGWTKTEAVLNKLIFWEEDHCRQSHLADIARARAFLDERE